MQENIVKLVWEISTCVHLCVCDRWKDIGTIAHNKSAITVEITSRDDTIIFHMVSVMSAGGLSTYTHNASHKVSNGKCNIKMCKHIPRYLSTETNEGMNLVLIFFLNATAVSI